MVSIQNITPCPAMNGEETLIKKLAQYCRTRCGGGRHEFNCTRPIYASVVFIKKQHTLAQQVYDHEIGLKQWKVSCPAGHGQVTKTKCAPCKTGKYSTRVGDNFCSLCSRGHFNDQTGQTECQPCGQGTFSNLTGVSQCQSCPAGKYGNETGAFECIDCPVGTFSTPVGLPHIDQCESCPRGKFSDKQGSLIAIRALLERILTTPESLFARCPLGAFSNITEALECQECPVGTYMNHTHAIQCLHCPIGLYSNSTGVSRCLDCQPVYSNSTGSIACQPCNPGRFTNISSQTTCQNCPVAKFSSVSGLSACLDCETGTFSDQTGLIQCKLCQTGTYSFTGYTSCSQCLYSNQSVLTTTNQLFSCSCTPGQFANLSSSQCQPCPNGTYSPTPAHYQCLSCELGKTSISGQSSLEDCFCQIGRGKELPVGSCDVCDRNSYSVNITNHYNVLEGQCRECTNGLRSKRGSSGIDACGRRHVPVPASAIVRARVICSGPEISLIIYRSKFT